MGDFDGQLRQRRRILSLFIFGGSRVRPHRPSRHLRPRMPTHRGSAALRSAAIAEEDQENEAYSNVVPQIRDWHSFKWGAESEDGRIRMGIPRIILRLIRYLVLRWGQTGA